MAGKNMSVGRLSIEMVADTVQYVNKLKKAEEETKNKLNGINKQFKKSSDSAKKAGKHMNGLSDRLKNMAQTAALIDGPLGGVASRLSVLSGVVAGGPLIASVVALGTAVAAVYKVLSSGVSTIDDTILQLGQLNAQMKLSGETIGFTAENLDLFARKLALSTLTSTTEVRKAMSVLATTTNLSGNAFKRTTELAQDISQVFGGSLISNAKILAKALDVPLDGLEKLERLQIRFTESQKDNIETLIKQNNLNKAQAIILDTISDKYKEIAKNAPSGTIVEQTDAMSQNWDEFTEALVSNTEVHGTLINTLSTINRLLVDAAKYVNPDLAIKFELEEQVADQVSEMFGDVDDVIENINNGSMKKLNDQLMLSEKHSKKLKDEQHNLAKIMKGGFLEATNQAKELLGTQARPSEVYSLAKEMVRDAEERFKLNDTLLLQEEILQNDLIALKTGANNKVIALREDELERTKQNNKERLEEEEETQKKRNSIISKANMALSDLTLKFNLDETLEKEFGDLSTKLKGMGIADIDPISLGEMSNFAIDDLENQIAIKEALLIDQSNRERKILEDSEKAKLDIMRKYQMESDFGSIDAKIELTAQRYADELETYKNHLMEMGFAKSESDALLMEQSAIIGQDLFNQTLALQTQQTDMFTTTLDTAMSSMSALGKEGSAASKALFLVNQGVALANAFVSKGVAVAKASELGPVAGPPAMAAAEASGIANIASIAAATIGGVAHGGLDSVPSESTFLLQKGERVVQPKANKDLTTFLSRKQNDTGNVSVSAPMTIQGNVTDQKWFQQELYKHRQLISSSINKAKREKPRRG